MKRFGLTVMIILMVSGLSLAKENSKFPKNHWKIFTTGLVKALKSDNDGLKQSAMVQIIRYKDKLNLTRLIFPLADIYDKHSNEKIRELATATLHYTDNKWAEEYLRKNYEKEKNPQIKHLIVSCIRAENRAAKYAVLEEKMELILASNNQ